MANITTDQPVTNREAIAFTLGLMALGVVELGRREVWLAFREVSSSIADPFTGLELAETSSLPTMLLIGLGVACSIFALGLGMNRASVRSVAGVVLSVTGGGLAVVAAQAANSLPDNDVVADGWQIGPLMAVAGGIAALIAGLVVAMGTKESRRSGGAAGAAAIGSLAIGLLAPVSTPSAEPQVVDGFAFHTYGEGGPRTGAFASDVGRSGSDLVIIDDQPMTVSGRFWEIDDGRIYRTHEVTDDDGNELFTRTTDYFGDRMYIGLEDLDGVGSIRVLAAQDYSTIGTVPLGLRTFAGIGSEGTVVVVDRAGDRLTNRVVENFDAVLADESLDVELSDPLADVGGSIDAVGEREGALAFLVEGRASLGVWRDGMHWNIYDLDEAEGQPCAGLDLPEETDEFSAIGAFDGQGRALVSFDRYDEPTDARVTDLYVVNLEDGSVRVITIPVEGVRAIASDDDQLYVLGNQLVEVLDYEAALASAPVLTEPLTACPLP